MILSRTPIRISFLGGGTDLPLFYKEDNGCVVSTTIDKFIYIIVNKKFDDKIRVSYSLTENVDSIDELKHELVRESLKLLNLKNSIEICSVSDIPSHGSGLGSSSSYVVGLLNALHAFKNEGISPKTLSEEACLVEIDKCKKPIGKQDQYISAFGGLNRIDFNANDEVVVNEINCKQQTINDLFQRLRLFYIGNTRSAGDILKQQQENLISNKSLRDTMRKMARIAREMSDSLNGDCINNFGEMLHESWMLKKSLCQSISNEKIEYYYDIARQAGAVGGKLLGAGGGGFLLVYSNLDNMLNVCHSLSDLEEVSINHHARGSEIIFRQ